MFFFWHASPSCISIPCHFEKYKVFTTHRSWRFIFPSFYFRSLSRKVFHSFQGSFLGLLAKPGTVSLSASVLKGMDSDTLAMCAIWICLCGDRMAPNILFVLLHRGTASASRLGRVRTTDMGRGYARRHLRHNLCLTAQPLSPCKTQNYTVAKLEACVCVCVCVCVCEALGVHLKWGIGIFLAWPTKRPTHYLLQMLFSSFQHFYIQCILYIPARWRTKNRMVVMKEIKLAED